MRLGLVFLVAATVLTAGIGGARSQPAESPRGPELRVATRVIAPFVMRNGEQLTGFSVDLWRAIAREMGVQTRFDVQESLPAMLRTVSERRADLAIAAISITAEREQQFDFSVPMFDAGLQIAVTGEASPLQPLWQLFASREIYQILGLLLLVTAVPALLMLWFERRHEEGIVARDGYARSFGKALWWSASTLGGQAEEMPRSAGGRIIALLWLLAVILLTTSLTAVITSSLTVNKLFGTVSGPQDLPGKRVATVAGSTSAEYLQRHEIAFEGMSTIADAYAALRANKIAAIVYDSPVLEYHVAHEGQGALRVVGPVFRKESYGILFAPNDPRRKAVNAALLRIRESGEYDSIYFRWFGSMSPEAK